MNEKHAFQKIGLLPFQSAFAANNSRFKIGLWARQTGKDHTATAEAVLDCFHHPGATWIIVAASERQALESLAKAKEWAGIIKFKIAEYHEAPLPGSTGASPVLPGASLAFPPRPYPSSLRSAEIKWSNCSRLIALPANPSTIRGYSANLILTEFAFHENPDALWRAIYPTISNPLRGGVKKLRIISTPNGLTNKFAQLWHSNAELHSAVSPICNRPALDPTDTLSQTPNNQSSIIDKQFPSPSVPSVSRHSVSSVLLSSPSPSPLFHRSRVTIHDAIRDGLPLDPAELQAGLNDPEAWAQEYLCEFMDNSTVLLPYDLIESCESGLASELSSLDALSASAIPGAGRPQLFAGLDFARKNHLTVCWILEKIPSSSVPSVSPPSAPSVLLSPPSSTSHLFLTREVHCLRNLSTPEQLEILRPRLNLCQRVCLDYTGPGIGLGDFLHRDFGSRLQLCTFTSSFKGELFPRLAAAFESRQLLIPIGRDIREDLHSLYRTVTNSGQILYRAHATPDGHADRTTALALALRAAQSTPQHACASSVGRKLPMFRGRSTQRTLAIIY